MCQTKIKHLKPAQHHKIIMQLLQKVRSYTNPTSYSKELKNDMFRLKIQNKPQQEIYIEGNSPLVKPLVKRLKQLHADIPTYHENDNHNNGTTISKYSYFYLGLWNLQEDSIRGCLFTYL